MAKKTKWCYWCGTHRLDKNLKRIMLMGPAKRWVYECMTRCKSEEK